MAGRLRSSGASTAANIFAREFEARRDFDRRLQAAGIAEARADRRAALNQQGALQRQAMSSGFAQPTFEGGQISGVKPMEQRGAELSGLLESAEKAGLEATFNFDSQGQIKGGSLRPPKAGAEIDKTKKQIELLGKFPLQPGGVTAEGQPKELLDFAPQIGTEITPRAGGLLGTQETPVPADQTSRELLSRLVSAAQRRGPEVLNQGSFRRVQELGGLGGFAPQLRALAEGGQTQTPTQTSDLQGPDIPPGEEGMRVELVDGSIWVVSGGQWVRES